MTIAAIFYLILELALLGSGIKAAFEQQWDQAQFFILTTGLARFYYTMQTKKK